MDLAPRNFVRFLDGRFGHAQKVAFVPGEFGARIRARSTDLMIDRITAQKLKDKHKLRYGHWTMMQVAINFGYALLERDDLVFAYIDDAVFRAIFILAVKEAANGEELWIKSFHRCKPRKLEKLLKASELLREHHP